MADSYNKKERQKNKQKKKREKAEKRLKQKSEGKKSVEFMYVDENGNLTTEKPDLSKKVEIKLEDIQVSTPKSDSLPEDDPIRTGIVNFFNTEKGYGFIVDDVTKESYFTHVNNLVDPVEEKDQVSFEINSGPKGLFAENVTLKK